jgi:hypothetical protein
MSRVVKVNDGDYIIQSQPGGNVILDVGGTGTVTVAGNLLVVGQTTEVETTNLTITDNIIVLNQGDTGKLTAPYGVTAGQSGVQIERGSYPVGVNGGAAIPSAQILWDEGIDHYAPLVSESVSGTFAMRIAGGEYTGLKLSTIVAGDTDIVFDLQNFSHVLRIANEGNYESRIGDDNDIPNIKFVTDYVSATGGTANVDNIHYPLTGSETSRVDAGPSVIDFIIAGNNRGSITTAGFNVDNVRLSDDTITNSSTSNLVLTATNNNIEVQAILNLNVLDGGTADPAFETGTTKLYTRATEGAGRTGIYFVNDTDYGANNYNSDELVSKNRAVLLSILL